MIRFGTDGVRGRAGELPCTPEVAVALGRAAARLALDHGGNSVLVGRDPRPSGDWLAGAVAAGVVGEGADALTAGVVPTSAVATALARGVACTGVMITASHNPWPDNGLKLFGPGGRKLTDAQQDAVEAHCALPPVGGPPGSVRDVAALVLQTYLAAWVEAVGPLPSLRGRRIAIDLANGAATSLADWLPHGLPCDVVLVGAEGLPNDGVGSEHPQALGEAVRRHGCDAGLAVDGDADRCVLVDDRGDVVSGDGLAWLLATGRGCASMAVTVMSNAALEGSLPGVRVVRTGVGDRHLLAAMEEHGLPLGVEESGHALFADALPAGDGLLTGLRALEAAFSRSSSLCASIAPFVPFPRVKDKVRVRTRPPLDQVAPLAAAVRDGESKLEGGRVFLRYSGTEPVLRILVEGPHAERVAEVAEAVLQVAEAELA